MNIIFGFGFNTSDPVCPKISAGLNRAEEIGEHSDLYIHASVLTIGMTVGVMWKKEACQ